MTLQPGDELDEHFTGLAVSPTAWLMLLNWCPAKFQFSAVKVSAAPPLTARHMRGAPCSATKD
jgi:hypothetical protein